MMETHSTSAVPRLGELLRYWREERGKSQLDLSMDTGISQRHLSFVESGRSTPSRDFLSVVSDALNIPLRERNVLLLASGVAPHYSEQSLDTGLTAEEARRFWQSPEPDTLKGKRDRAILAVLLGCGFRRRELADLDFVHLQQREEHWAIVDLVGKGGHIRTVPMPEWVKTIIDVWVAAAGISTGRLFRCVCRAGKHWGDGVSERLVWHVVKQYGRELGLAQVAPHDLRRSCAKLCHASGGELDQIQFLLGHVFVQTTERYLGCKQRIRGAVNDHIGIKPSP